VLVQLRKVFPKDVRIVFRNFPLNIHDKAIPAAQAAEAAGMQGKFFEMQQALFAGQADWSAFTPEQFDPWLEQQAKQIGLDVNRFNTDRKGDAVKQKVQAAVEDGSRIGIPGTPFMLIEGRPYQGPRDFNSLEGVVKMLNMQDKMFTECPQVTIDIAKKYYATLQTEKGDVVVELFPAKAPVTVNSFIFLARKGWFDGNIFHRVIPGFVAQAGDPSGSGYGGPGYAFGNEITVDMRYDKPGLLGMANAGPDSNGSQFFITFAPQPMLDGRYTIFGQVITGLDVLEKLAPRDPSSGQALPPGDKILKVTIEEK
jgi:cyclophilin family peptidyl-prolyl cis-trans isomerase